MPTWVFTPEDPVITLGRISRQGKGASLLSHKTHLRAIMPSKDGGPTGRAFCYERGTPVTPSQVDLSATALETDTCIKSIDLMSSFYYSDP
jgi:hypothetical protein